MEPSSLAPWPSAALWMLEEYASTVGREYAERLERSVSGLVSTTVTSPTPLGIQADGVAERAEKSGGNTYFVTTGLRLLARSGGNVLLLPADWSLHNRRVIVVPERDDLVWNFSRE